MEQLGDAGDSIWALLQKEKAKNKQLLEALYVAKAQLVDHCDRKGDTGYETRRADMEKMKHTKEPWQVGLVERNPAD
jgi:hypothetical protein